MKSKSAKIIVITAIVFLMSLVLSVGFVSAAEDSIIESISIEKVTLIKNYDGEVVSESGKSDYFRYNSTYPSKVTVRLSNGKAITDTFAAIEDYFGQKVTFTDTQSADAPWKAGTYTVKYSFMGYNGTYSVEIKDTPVERITAKNVELKFLGDGYYDELSNGNRFYYYSAPKEMTVYFKDGTVKTGTAESFEKHPNYTVTVHDSQEKTSWNIGSYKCKVEYMGVYAEYYAIVKESPVKSIAVDDVTLYEGIDGSYNGKNFRYDAKPDKVTIYYKDGTAFTGSVEEVEKETGYAVSFDTEKVWSYGKQVATATYLGATTKFIANVKEYPIEDITLYKKPEKKEYIAGELFNFKGSAIKISYTNGKTEVVDLVQDYEKGYIDCRLETIKKNVRFDSFIEVEAYSDTIDVDFLESFFLIPVSVSEKSIESVELTKNSNGIPSLNFKFNDGSKESKYILNIIYGNYNEMELGGKYEAVIITALGEFNVIVTRKLEGYSLAFSSNVGKDIVTAYCDGVIWAESAMTERARIIYNFFDGTDSYKGLVESGNIDKLLTYAAIGSNAGEPKEVYTSYRVYTTTEIQKCIKDFFALDGIDVSLSKKYNTKTNTVRIDIPANVYNDHYFYETGVAYPVDYQFNDGFFKGTYKFTDGKTMEINADKEGRIVSYKINDVVLHKHTMVTIPGTAATYFKTGLTDGVKCSSCGEVLTKQQTVAKLILGKTSKIVVKQNTKAIKVSWKAVKGATGYEVYYKSGSSGWKNASTTTDKSLTISNLSAGKIYKIAVKAYVIENGKVLKAETYTTIETATQPLKPSKMSSSQSDSVIKLTWSKSTGATGYRIYYKTSSGWKRLRETTKTSATFTNLKKGSKYTFAVKPYIKTASGVVWSNSYITYVAATKPAAPTIKATSPGKGKLSVTFGKVNGAEAYQLFYKPDGGKLKLYKNYTKAGTIKFSSLKSGKTYTFYVRAAKKTSGGWIYGPYNSCIVTVK